MRIGLFLREGLRHLGEVGTIIPTSRFTAERMCYGIDFSRTSTVVEWGPGDGSVTREILDRLAPDAQLHAFEVNDTFCELLREIDDPRLHIHARSALDLPRVLRSRPDAIISTLPLAIMDEAPRAINLAHRRLRKGGVFNQIQYSLLSRRLIAERFARPKIVTSFRNLPPAIVYHCRK